MLTLKQTVIDPLTGQKWTLKLVQPGERYGLNDSLIADKAMIEFYDADQDLDKFGPDGQFVSRYTTRTLLDGTGGGINLQGGVDRWSVSWHVADVARSMAYGVKQHEKQDAKKALIAAGAELATKEDHHGDTKFGWWQDTVYLGDDHDIALESLNG